LLILCVDSRLFSFSFFYHAGMDLVTTKPLLEF
jgi:hypothetical protein